MCVACTLARARAHTHTYIVETLVNRHLNAYRKLFTYIMLGLLNVDRYNFYIYYTFLF